ncbi:MAG: EAL domain-containing protein [Aquificota bacterium]|nr:MAG: EAL domain-containing protein [Aquificota bacterium]
MFLLYVPEEKLKEKVLKVVLEQQVECKDYGEVLLINSDDSFVAQVLEELIEDEEEVADSLKLVRVEPQDFKNVASLLKKVFKAQTLRDLLEETLYKNISDIMYNSKTFFQAIVSVKDKNIYAFEALCRSPFPIYKIMQLGGHVAELMDEFCRYKALREFSKRFERYEHKVSLNFHPKFIKEPLKDLGDLVSASVSYGIAPERVVVEITEYEGMDINALKQLRSFLKKEGVLVALDDVGEGYSGLYQFVELKPDIVKLDMKLVRNCHLNPVKRHVVHALVSVCRSLGIITLAEGVEKREELEVLLDMGVDLIQGFLVAKPDPNPKLEETVKKVRELMA